MARPQQHQQFESIEDKFNRLKQVWEHDTSHLSSVTQSVSHPAYKEIARMGRSVVPYIIREMRENRTGAWWSYALHQILGDTGPHIPEYARGRMHLINDMWVAWYEHNYGPKRGGDRSGRPMHSMHQPEGRRDKDAAGGE